jgi:hypothetical protein
VAIDSLSFKNIFIELSRNRNAIVEQDMKGMDAHYKADEA